MIMEVTIHIDEELLSKFAEICSEANTTVEEAFVAFASAAVGDREMLAELVRQECIVNNCVADLAFEGMVATEEDKARMRRVARGETTAKDEVAKIVAKYKCEPYMFIIRLKDTVSDEQLALVTKLIEKAFDNRAGCLKNVSTEPRVFVFHGDTDARGPLDLGALALVETKGFLELVESWDYLDERPAECCNMLDVFARHPLRISRTMDEPQRISAFRGSEGSGCPAKEADHYACCHCEFSCDCFPNYPPDYWKIAAGLNTPHSECIPESEVDW